MRNKAAKVLRQMARAQYLMMLSSKEIPAPESRAESERQLRKLYRAGKKAYGSMPSEDRGKLVKPYRRSRIDRLYLQQKQRGSVSKRSLSKRSLPSSDR